MTANPVLTERHVDQLGVASVENLARLAFRRAHRGLPQYAGYLDDPARGRVRAVRLTRDLSADHGTFARYNVGDVVLAWTPRPVFGRLPETVAFCPRVGWNVQLPPGCWEEITTD